MRRRLEGAGIVVTRPGGTRDRLAVLLAAEGARVLPFPALRLVPQDKPAPAEPMDAILFTSPAAVEFGLPRLKTPLPALRLAPGQGTRAALVEGGMDFVFAPSGGAGLAALLTELPACELAGKSLLVVCGSPVNEANLEVLEEHGARPLVFSAYRRDAVREPRPLKDWLESGAVDVIMASSTAAVKAMTGLADINLQRRDWIASSTRVAETIRAAGGRIATTAASAEADDMAAAAREWWHNKQHSGDTA